jgi:hypothetical protein
MVKPTGERERRVVTEHNEGRKNEKEIEKGRMGERYDRRNKEGRNE